MDLAQADGHRIVERLSVRDDIYPVTGTERLACGAALGRVLAEEVYYQ